MPRTSEQSGSRWCRSCCIPSGGKGTSLQHKGGGSLGGSGGGAISLMFLSVGCTIDQGLVVWWENIPSLFPSHLIPSHPILPHPIHLIPSYPV